MGDDAGGAEKGLDAVVVDVDPQALADRARRRAVEDAVDEEAAGPGDADDGLGEVGGAAGGQRPQRRRLEADGVLPAAIAAGDELVDEAAPVGGVVEIAAAAQDQRLVERGLAVAVVGLHRAVLVGLAGIAAAGDEAVVGAEALVAPGDVRRRLLVEVSVGGRQAVGAVLAGDAAQGPERVLEVLGQGGEALAAGDDGGVLPAAAGHHEVEEPVRERSAGDGDAELGCVGEVGQRHASRLRGLAEDTAGSRSRIGSSTGSHTTASGSETVRPRSGWRWDGSAGVDPAPGALAEPGPGGGDALAVTMAVLHAGSRLLIGDGSARHGGTSVWMTENPGRTGPQRPAPKQSLHKEDDRATGSSFQPGSSRRGGLLHHASHRTGRADPHPALWVDIRMPAQAGR